MNTEKIKKYLNHIGGEMVVCENDCLGISGGNEDNHTNGIVPRGMFLDGPETDGPGVIVVGINPGKSSKTERKVYKSAMSEGKPLYPELWKKENQKTKKKFSYHKRIEGLLGTSPARPIFWTDLVKCETAPARKKAGKKSPPAITFKACMNEFFRRELAAISPDWPIIAAGQEVYKFLTSMYPDRTIFGIYHPGAVKMDKNAKKFYAKGHRILQNAIKRFKLGQAVWLPGYEEP